MIMKVLVVYDSLGGNTEKMARAIAAGARSFEGVEAEAIKIGEPFPLVALVDCTYGGLWVACNLLQGHRRDDELPEALDSTSKQER